LKKVREAYDIVWMGFTHTDWACPRAAIRDSPRIFFERGAGIVKTCQVKVEKFERLDFRNEG
jgi:hypothetical protein